MQRSMTPDQTVLDQDAYGNGARSRPSFMDMVQTQTKYVWNSKIPVVLISCLDYACNFRVADHKAWKRCAVETVSTERQHMLSMHDEGHGVPAISSLHWRLHDVQIQHSWSRTVLLVSTLIHISSVPFDFSCEGKLCRLASFACYLKFAMQDVK